jgi:alpha-L-fucosidase
MMKEMLNTKLWFAFVLAFVSLITTAQQKSKDPLPTKQQLTWHEMEYYWFIHFGPNTFTDKEWGHGDEPEDIFNPTELDCRQWARIAKQAGAKGIIITAKHHDGFCLWPSKYSQHTVRESKWKGGKGDVVKDLMQACEEYGLKFGVYLSPWDRNHPQYGRPEYNDVYVNTMKELIDQYGPFFEFWWDGANGEGPNGKKQQYDFPRFEQTIRKYAPNTVVFSDIGPDVRWAGNEKGIAGQTNWNLLDTAGFKRGEGAPPTDRLNQGNINGKNWIPAECDVSIRPGWFYHKEEDGKVKTPELLFDLYLKSVGRGANFLLNIPPDRRGLINEIDSASLVAFKKLREESFKVNIAKAGTGYFIPHNGTRPAPHLNDGNNRSSEYIYITHLKSVGIEFKTPQTINCIVLKEDLSKGQSCKTFSLLLMNQKHELLREIKGTTIGNKRIITFPSTELSIIALAVNDQKSITAISEIETYLINDELIDK